MPPTTYQEQQVRVRRLRPADLDAVIALDGHAAGASYREIAAVIFGRDRVARDWPDPSLKDPVRHSLSRGQAYANGGYRALIV